MDTAGHGGRARHSVNYCKLPKTVSYPWDNPEKVSPYRVRTSSEILLQSIGTLPFCQSLNNLIQGLQASSKGHPQWIRRVIIAPGDKSRVSPTGMSFVPQHLPGDWIVDRTTKKQFAFKFEDSFLNSEFPRARLESFGVEANILEDFGTSFVSSVGRNNQRYDGKGDPDSFGHVLGFLQQMISRRVSQDNTSGDDVAE